ncbi:hypothetical protein CYY_009358 [Polysphondylium violaceum]|uniref:Uncharacterized protein n=1 Tax=Polysphondylium violaceum TaxID=133409 RepID=A0A8J4PMY3_9MYCE|nr:hypothetical protein CYY_009358 [Polysphondylium violaceum]
MDTTEETIAKVETDKASVEQTENVGLGQVVIEDSMKSEFDDVIEKDVLKWVKDQLNKEKKRITSMGSKSIAVDVKNTGIVKEEEPVRIINRLELNTNFNFDRVGQILISDSVEVPMKKGFRYINVLLFSNNPVPLIVPYVYQESPENTLTEWLFINNQFARSRHTIKEFSAV